METIETFKQDQKKQQIDSQLNQDSMQEVQQQADSVNLQMQQQQQEIQTNSQDVLSAHAQVQIHDRAQRVRDAVSGRTISAILTAEVTNSDSTEMAAVKEKIMTCNELLDKKLSMAGDMESIREQLKVIEITYLDAITACQYYCDHRNPIFESGKLRKKAVSDTLELLKSEIQLLPQLQNMLSEEKLSEYGEEVKFIDLIAEAGIMQEDAQTVREQRQEEKAAQVQENPIESLKYEDFSSLLTADPADFLEFRGQSLRIVKSGILSNPGSVATENNKKMVERFITLAIQKLEKGQKLSEIQQTNMKMRLQHQLNVGLLDTQAGAVSISKLRDAMEMVDHLSSDVDRALQRDKYVSPMEHRLAMAVNEKLEIPTRMEAESKAIYKKLQNILEDARKAGIRIPPVEDEELDNIVAGRLYAIRDEVFHNMRRIYQYMCNLNGGKAADFSALASDQKIVNCMLALSISRMTADSSAWAEAAEYQMRNYMAQAVFAHCGKPSLEQDFQETRISALAMNGSSGLYAQVLRQASTTKNWKEQIGSVTNGMHNLGEVCSLLEKLGTMQSKAFCEGLTEDEAKELVAIGVQLQDIVDQEDIVSDMKLVAENMKGTRFADGFGQLQKLIQKPGVFKDSADRIAKATKLTGKKEDFFEKSPLELEQEKQRKKLDIEDETTHIKLSEAAEVLSGLTGETKMIASMLLMEKNPSDLIQKNGDENAKDLVALYYSLQSLKSGDAWADVTVGNVQMTLMQRDNGDVELKIGRKRIPMPFNTAFLIHRLEQDVSENLEKYGDKLAEDVLQTAFARTKQRILSQEENTEDTSRLIYLNVLKQKTGLEALFFRNVAVETLSQMAEYALKGMMDRADVEQLVEYEKESDLVMLNERDTLEAIRMMEQREKLQKNAKQTVIIQEQRKEEDNKQQWEPDEAELMELISDMVFSKDTWKLDMERREPADRLRMLMYEHSELLVKLIKRPELIAQTFNKLQIPGVEGLADMVKEEFEGLIQNDAMSKLKGLNDKNLLLIVKAVLGDEQDMKNAQPAIRAIETGIRWAKKMSGFFGSLTGASKEEQQEEEKTVEEMLLEQKASMKKTFEDMDEELNQQTTAQVNRIQEEINKAVGQVFDTKDQVVRSLDEMTLSQILEENTKGQEGQGKFYKLILTQYFQNADIMDQRAMIASALRDAKPAQLKSGEEQGEKEKDEQMGAFLGGFLKGAGPLLHKVLQGLPMNGMPESLKIAIGDMKSKLSPIAPSIVKARMDKLRVDSNGMITNIEVQRSLGAASIGQVFLCKIYGPNLQKEGKDVVIKLLRPDVQNHLEREKGFMLKCAGDTSEGMLRTFQGQLRAIEQELDFRIEAKNTELGKIYDQGSKTVQSMKTVNLIRPDTNVLMLEKAPGTTVDKYLKEVKEEYENIKREFINTIPQDSGYAAMNRLQKLIEEMAKRQGYVTELAEKWIKAGIYKEGFYHGDLHAGNIMVDSNQATILDFGNATQITKEQQKSILHMVCAAAAQNIEGFRHHFHLLLSPESEGDYQQKKAAFTEMLGTVLFKEGDVGERIAVVLAEAQKIGLELPAAIHNFSQCQIRLKNTVDDMVTQIKEMNTELKKMNSYHAGDKNKADAFTLIGEDVWKNIAQRDSYNKKETRNKPQPLEFVVKSKLYETPSFDEEYYKRHITDNLPHMGRLTKIHKCLNSLRTIQKTAGTMLELEDENRELMKEGYINSVNNLFNNFVKDFQVNPQIFEELKSKMLNFFNQPEPDINVFKGYIEEFYTIPKNNELIDAYLLKRRDVWKLEEDKSADKGMLNKAKDQLCAEAKKLYEIEAASPYEKMQREMLSKEPEEQRSFENKMRDWFEDKDNYGEALSQTYNRILELKNGNTPLDGESEPVKDFRELFEKAAIQRAHRIENRKDVLSQIAPKDFFDVMAEVVKGRLTKTGLSLGATGIYRYILKPVLKLNKKPQMGEEAARRQRQRQEAENVMKNMEVVLQYMIEVAMKLQMMPLEADEAKRKEKKDDILDLINKFVIERIYKMPLSEQDRVLLGGELALYISSSDVKHIYNTVKRLAEIWKDKGRLLPDSEYAEDAWDEMLVQLQELQPAEQQNAQ